MKENLILEGNTIYEIDPVCMKMKTQPQRRQAAGGGRIAEAEMESCRHGNGRGRKCFVILGALMLAGCQTKHRKQESL